LLNEHADDMKATLALSSHRSVQTHQDEPLGLPLAGLRIAEITVVWAGPHVPHLLAEWGAEVIRVEPVNKPQPYTRGMENVPSRAQANALAARGVPTRLMANDPGPDPWNCNASFNSHARHK